MAPIICSMLRCSLLAGFRLSLVKIRTSGFRIEHNPNSLYPHFCLYGWVESAGMTYKYAHTLLDSWILKQAGWQFHSVPDWRVVFSFAVSESSWPALRCPVWWTCTVITQSISSYYCPSRSCIKCLRAFVAEMQFGVAIHVGRLLVLPKRPVVSKKHLFSLSMYLFSMGGS